MALKLNVKKAIKAGGGPAMDTVEKLGKIALPMGIMIVILAVMSFH